MGGFQSDKFMPVRIRILMLVLPVMQVLFTGITRGDWWLPAVFSVIPVIAIVYCLVLARNAT